MTRAPKPTPAQRRVLEALADGAVIRRDRYGPFLDMGSGGYAKPVRWQTAEVLRVNGWINWPDRGVQHHTITPAGLAAIGRTE